jgi:hypothetical protein
MVFLGSVTLYREWITHRFVVASAISCILFADIALAQTPPNIQGNWVAKTADCGDLHLKITSQAGPVSSPEVWCASEQDRPRGSIRN